MSTESVKSRQVTTAAPSSWKAMTVDRALSGIKSITDGERLTVIENNALQKELREAGLFERPKLAEIVNGRMNGYTFIYAKLNHAWSAKEAEVQGVAIAPDGNVFKFSGKAGVGMFKKDGQMGPNEVDLDFSDSTKPIGRSEA